MLHRMKQNGALLFGAGLSLGLLVGIGMLIGALVAHQGNSQTPQFPAELLHATSTDSSNTMAIATGPIGDGIEGLFVLDFITGYLRCQVLNPRTGGAGGIYEHNVAADLGVQEGKQPRYLMTTGAAEFRYQGGGNVRPAACVLYVADTNTGRYVAYMLPWNPAAAQYNATQRYPMIPLFHDTARNLIIE